MSLVSILLGFQFYCMAIAADSSSPTGLPLATDWVTAGVAAVLETSTAAAVVASATVAVIAAADSIITAAVRGSTSVCVAPAKCFVSYHSSISLAQKLPAYKAATRIVLLLSSLGGHCYPCSALAMDGAGSRRVLVTGAGGQTGQHVFRKLLARPGYVPVGTVRSEDSRKALLEGSSGVGASHAASSSPVPPESVVVCDISTADHSVLDDLMKDCDALFVCTSAKPAPTGEVDEASGRPKFGFPNGDPELVDWIGQRNLIDAAARRGGVHVVLCSSMGGTNPDHPLNNLGKVTNADGTKSGGDILKWKRRAEVHLVRSGCTYTIVHPRGPLH